MTKILRFKAPKKKAAPARGLCQHGHHKWLVDKQTQFDSQQGRLVTRFRCSRCAKTKVKAL